MLEIGAIVTILGLVATAVAYVWKYLAPTWLASYGTMVNRPEGDYNVILLLAGPLLLIIGGFYLGEQLVLRRRFDKMLDTPKKSEFSSRRKDLEDLSKRLPDAYSKKISAKENEFASKRA